MVTTTQLQLELGIKKDQILVTWNDVVLCDKNEKLVSIKGMQLSDISKQLLRKICSQNNLHIRDNTKATHFERVLLITELKKSKLEHEATEMQACFRMINALFSKTFRKHWEVSPQEKEGKASATKELPHIWQDISKVLRKQLQAQEDLKFHYKNPAWTKGSNCGHLSKFCPSVYDQYGPEILFQRFQNLQELYTKAISQCFRDFPDPDHFYQVSFEKFYVQYCNQNPAVLYLRMFLIDFPECETSFCPSIYTEYVPFVKEKMEENDRSDDEDDIDDAADDYSYDIHQYGSPDERPGKMAQWRNILAIGSKVDALCPVSLLWCKARIISTGKNSDDLVELRFIGWGSKYDMKTKRWNKSLAPYNWFTGSRRDREKIMEHLALLEKDETAKNKNDPKSRKSSQSKKQGTNPSSIKVKIKSEQSAHMSPTSSSSDEDAAVDINKRRTPGETSARKQSSKKRKHSKTSSATSNEDDWKIDMVKTMNSLQAKVKELQGEVTHLKSKAKTDKSGKQYKRYRRMIRDLTSDLRHASNVTQQQSIKQEIEILKQKCSTIIRATPQ